MSTALYTLIFSLICFLLWRSFMKHKEIAIEISKIIEKKENIEILDESICLRKIVPKIENNRIAIYRIYSFDYNIMESFKRFRAYIVLKNSKFDEYMLNNPKNNNYYQPSENNQNTSTNSNKIINFDD